MQVYEVKFGFWWVVWEGLEFMEGLSALAEEFALRLLSKYIHEMVEKGKPQSLIYFTVFLYEPVNEGDVTTFVENILNKYKCEKQVTHPLFQRVNLSPVCVGNSKFAVIVDVTTYEDLLSSEAYFERVSNIIHGDETRQEYPILEDLGLSKEDFKKLSNLVKDFTLVLYPIDLHTDDLIVLLRYLYDESKSTFPVEDRLVKVDVYGDEKSLIDIERVLKSRYRRNVRVYLGENRVVIIPHEWLSIDKEFYNAIYGHGLLDSLKRILSFSK